jgi:general secretion pathway protein B
MSFILDALRRSEHERQRQAGPALVEAPIAPPRVRSNPWATAAIALLVVNLAAIGVLLLMRSNGEQAAVPAPAATPSAQSPQASAPAQLPLPQPIPHSTPTAVPPVAAAPSALPGGTLPAAARTPPMLRPAEPAPPLPGRNPLEAEVVEESPPLDDEAVARAAAPPPGPPAVVRAPTRGGTVVYQPLSELEPVTSRPSSAPASNLPTADELTARGGLPELKLELHVYSSKPPERFVFVNGSRYREGDTTREGAQVEEITRDGVVMNLRGNRFLLPRE